jgi:hypothetical protein
VDNLKVILIAAVIAGHAVLGYTELDAWSYADMREVTLRPAVAYVLLATFAPVDGATRMSWFWRVRPSYSVRWSPALGGVKRKGSGPGLRTTWRGLARPAPHRVVIKDLLDDLH